MLVVEYLILCRMQQTAKLQRGLWSCCFLIKWAKSENLSMFLPMSTDMNFVWYAWFKIREWMKGEEKEGWLHMWAEEYTFKDLQCSDILSVITVHTAMWDLEWRCLWKRFDSDIVIISPPSEAPGILWGFQPFFLQKCHSLPTLTWSNWQALLCMTFTKRPERLLLLQHPGSPLLCGPWISALSPNSSSQSNSVSARKQEMTCCWKREVGYHWLVSCSNSWEDEWFFEKDEKSTNQNDFQK